MGSRVSRPGRVEVGRQSACVPPRGCRTGRAHQAPVARGRPDARRRPQAAATRHDASQPPRVVGNIGRVRLRLAGALAPADFGETSLRSGCSAAWLAHLTGGQGVAGSNPAIPTTFSRYIPVTWVTD